MRKSATAIIAGVTGAVILATQAHAISRVNTAGKTCQAVQNIVAAEGAVILRYPSKRGTGNILYDRYVSSQRFCVGGDVTERFFVPTADTANCRVKRCINRDSSPREFFIFRD